MIERLDFGKETLYNATEATIHLSRYLMAKPYVAGKRVLDVACGEGYGSYLMSLWGAKSVCGVDVDAPTVENAAVMFKNDGLEYLCCNAEALPFPDYSFDVIASFETIEHLEHPEEFLTELRRVLKPGGTILLSCPNDYYYYENAPVDNPFHKHKYHFYDFKELSEKYLGKASHYYLGFAADGFVTIPLEDATLPEEHAAPDTMLEMFQYRRSDNAALLKQQRLMNYWNCNYYIGLWSGNPTAAIPSSAIYPRETFVKLEDTDLSIYHDLRTRMDALTNAEKAAAAAMDELKELREKNGQLEDTIARQQAELEAQKELLPETKRLEIENDRLRMMLELAAKENAAMYQYRNVHIGGELTRQLEYYRSECDRYENSTCWKITKPIRIILDFLKKIFRR